MPSLSSPKPRLVCCLLVCLLGALLPVKGQAQSVSNRGSLTYDIPIEIPKATMGMKPDLALVHDSHLKNGMMGVGWAIKGMSTIHRDMRYAVNFNSNDHYALDGNKLIYNSSAGRYHSEYEDYSRIQAFSLNTTSSYWLVTKKNGYKYYYGNSVDSHIDAVGKAGKALTWALRKVMDPNGNYFLISYSEDTANGDFYPTLITYTDNDTFGISGDNTVVFEYYDGRTDHHVKYMPTKVDMNRRLSAIYVRVAGVQLRKYVLTYAYSGNTGNSLLTKVQEFGKDNGSLPAREFTWDDGFNGVGFEAVSEWLPQLPWGSTDPSSARFMNGDSTYPDGTAGRISHLYIDMNGDGLLDRVGNYYNGTYGLYVALNTGNGLQSVPSRWLADNAWGGGLADTYAQYTDDSDHTVRMLIDMDGDGLPDRVSSKYGGDAGLYVGLNTGSGFAAPTQWLNSGAWGYADDCYPQTSDGEGGTTRVLLDLTGDGRPDRVSYEYLATYGLWVGVNNGSGFNIPTRWLSHYAWGSAYDRYPEREKTYSTSTGVFGVFQGIDHTFRDMNGDGLLDRLASSYNGTPGIFVGLNTGSGFATPTPWLTDTRWGNAYQYPIAGAGPAWSVDSTLEDMNGDGLLDRVGAYFNGVRGMFVGLNNGYGFNTPTLWDGRVDCEGKSFGWRVKYHNCDEQALTSDLNGDGMPDRIMYIDGSWWPYLGDDINTVMYNKGNGFRSAQTFYPPTGWVTYWDSFPYSAHDISLSLADMNGDGILDQVIYGRVYLGKGDLPDKIIQVKNGRGGLATIEYKPASQTPNAIIGANVVNYTYPQVANTTPRELVSKITSNSGLNTKSFTYTYYKGMTHAGPMPDRVDLGFNYINKRDDETLKTQRIVYYQSFPLQGQVYDNISYDAAWRWEGYRAYRRAWRQDSGSPAGVRFVYLANQYNLVRKTNNDYDRSRKSFTYDLYGNISNLTHFGQDIPALTGDESNLVTEYIYNTSSWILNKPKRVLTYGLDVNLVNGLQRETKYYYDSLAYGSVGKGSLTKEELVDVDRTIVVVHGYDNWGNRTLTRDGKGNETTTVFDGTYHADVTSAEDALGHVKNSIFDSLRRLITFTDENNVPTYHRYDQFGRRLKMFITPDNETYPTKQEDYFVDGVFPEFKRTWTREVANTGSVYETRVYYDGKGQVIQQKSESCTAGYYDTVDMMYDGSGRKVRETVPYRTTTIGYTAQNWANGYSATSYDASGRVTQVTYPDGSLSRIIHDGFLKYSIDTTNRVKSARVNGQGKIVEVKEFDGVYPNHILYATTSYRYNTGTGHLVRVTDTAGLQLNYTYNLLGQRTRMVHPDRGQWDFTFDANGNVSTQIDGNRETITYEYDDLDRLTAKRYPSGGDTEYLYDETGHGYAVGHPTSISYAAGSDDFTYNGRGQITSQSVTIGTETRTESFTYDSMGRIRNVTYPDGEVVAHTYGLDSQLKTVAGASTYLTNALYTASGRPSTLSYGNGKITTFDYYDLGTETDPNTGRTRSQQVRRISVPGVLDLSYQYDLKGNVQRKGDNLNSTYTETYIYDHLHRLYSASSTVYGGKEYRYDAIGNMTQKDGVTSLFSGHSLTAKGSTDYEYDTNGNMISAGDKTFTYNFDNMLTGVSDGASFEYFGKFRVKKIENGKMTLYFFPNYHEKQQ